MEYRKIIEFGKSSFVVSIPKNWLNESKLGKGDVIYVGQEGDRLVLYPVKEKKSSEPKSVTIDVTNLNKREIRLQVISKYIRNFNEITLTADNMTGKAKDIRAILHNLIALEVFEEDTTKIVAKDFLNMEEISPREILKKMDLITRELITDSKNTFKEDKYESIRQRDEDINRLSFLLSRTLQYLNRNPASAKRQNLCNSRLMAIWMANASLEHIADQVKWATKLMRIVKFKKSEQEEFIKLYSVVEKYYLDSMEALFSWNPDAAFRLLAKSKKVIKQCKDFNRQNWNIQHVPVVMEKLKTMVGEAKYIMTYVCDVE